MLGIVKLNDQYFKTELNELERVGALAVANKLIDSHNETVYGENYGEKLETVYRAFHGEIAKLELMYDTILKIEGSFYLISYVAVFGTDTVVFCAYESDENGNELESEETIYIVAV